MMALLVLLEYGKIFGVMLAFEIASHFLLSPSRTVRAVSQALLFSVLLLSVPIRNNRSEYTELPDSRDEAFNESRTPAHTEV